MTSLQLPPRADAPVPAPWPGWSGERRSIRPGPALAALIAETSSEWPGWSGARVGPNHLDHFNHARRD